MLPLHSFLPDVCALDHCVPEPHRQPSGLDILPNKVKTCTCSRTPVPCHLLAPVPCHFSPVTFSRRLEFYMTPFHLDPERATLKPPSTPPAPPPRQSSPSPTHCCYSSQLPPLVVVQPLENTNILTLAEIHSPTSSTSLCPVES